MTRRTILTALCPLGALVVSCSILGPIPDQSRYYILTLAEPRSDEPSRVHDGSPAYALGPVTLPEYLDRNQIVTRLSPSEVTYSQWDRWAEPLETNVATVLRRRLTVELGVGDVTRYPWTGDGVDYQIEVTFLRLETDMAGQNVLSARWSIRDVRRDGAIVTGNETTLTRPGPPGDRAASTHALSEMVRDLGDEIAHAARDLPRPTAHQAKAKAT